jgi:ABC-2 type transport system permease protein
MKNKILQSIIKKEYLHIMKDPQTLFIIFLLPVIMMLLFGFAITMEMRDIPTIIADRSDTPQSRALIERIGSSGFFKVTRRDIRDRDVDTLFRKKQAHCIVIFPEKFARDLEKDRRAELQVLIDASDPNAANLINNYLQVIVARQDQQVNRVVPVPFLVEPRFMYNPDLRSANFFVPGLMAIILLMISALLTSIAITREKETGTMEQILVSPVHPVQIIIGKVIPYITIAFICGISILFMGVTIFAVPFRGSLPALMLAMLLYTTTGLSFGLLISTVTNSQRNAMLLAALTTMLPTIMLSGYIFPVESMPTLFRIISNIIPARHFVLIVRGIMLKGISLSDLWPQVLYLTGLSMLLLTVSVKKFKNTLE